MSRPPDPSPVRPGLAIVYHSAAGGTRLVAELLAELLSADHDVKEWDIHADGAAAALAGADFVVLCYPTYFLRPSLSIREFIGGLAPAAPPKPVYLVTTYELYTENSLRVCARLAKDKGLTVTGSAAIRAPGSDLTCLFPERLFPALYRFEKSLGAKLLAAAGEIRDLARRAGRERLPRIKWYTPLAQVLQRGFLDGFFGWRKKMRILPDRCTACGNCVSGCDRGAMLKDGPGIRHDWERCELCTRCIHRCPRKAVVLRPRVKDNRRLDVRLYNRLKEEARADLRRAC